MMNQLPLELVAEVLGVAAEISLVNGSRNTVLELVRVCSLGYKAVIPVLYRTLTVNENNHDMVLRVFESRSPETTNILSQPPLQRLCVHIRRVFLENQENLGPTRLCQLHNLSAIYCCSFEHNLFESDEYQQLARTITHLYALTSDFPIGLPQSVTHASFYMQVVDPSDVEDFKIHMRSLPLSVTHVAVEINRMEFDDWMMAEMLALLQELLARNSTAPVVLRLYCDAAACDIVDMIVETTSHLGSPEARMRVHIWHDKRNITSAEDIPTSRRDAIVGKTPWSEASVKSAYSMRQDEDDTTRAIEPLSEGETVMAETFSGTNI